MGIYGAALATILGLVLSFLMGIYYFARKYKALSFTLHGLSAGLALRSMVNGASEFVDQLAIAITTIVFNRTALAFAGEDGVAAVSIIMYLQFPFLFPGAKHPCLPNTGAWKPVYQKNGRFLQSEISKP